MTITLACDLAAYAWAISVTAGYHLGLTLLTVLGLYVALLLTYAACHRLVQWTRFRRHQDPTIDTPGV